MTADADSDEVYTSLVDAASGDVFRSDNKVDDVTGLAWDYYPGAASGGTQVSRDFTALGWLSGSAETPRRPHRRTTATRWSVPRTTPTARPSP